MGAVGKKEKMKKKKETEAHSLKHREEEEEERVKDEAPRALSEPEALDGGGSPVDSGSDYEDYSEDGDSEDYELSEEDVEFGEEGATSSDSDQDEFEDGDSEEFESSESGESDSQEHKGFVKTSNKGKLSNDHAQIDDSESEISESDRRAEESDSSEDEVPSRNTIGDVPLEWYRDEEHIGYDVKGKKIKKKERQDKLDAFLASADDSKNWRKIHDEYNDEVVELTKDETRLIHRLLKGKAPHAGFDPYPDYVDFFKWDDAKHPLSNAPEPKRRFIPSKWEAKKVAKYVRAIREGLIKLDKPKEEPRFYLLWGDEPNSKDRAGHLAYIPAPKPKLPGHEESYNPSLEYIPTQEEINSYQLMYEEDRPKFIPRRYTSLKSVPAYENAVNDSFERCMDLYMSYRAWKKRLNIDPESLKPKLPSRKDLKPYPVTCYLEYRGHEGAVVSISTEVSGQWIASGSADGTVRIWEVETGRCRGVWTIGEPVQCVSWNPLSEVPILAIVAGQDVLLVNTGLGNEEDQKKINELLQVEISGTAGDSDEQTLVSWLQDDRHKHEAIRLRHFKTVTSVEWHRKGDYLSTVTPADILVI